MPASLQALCQEIHSKITVVDEERYNIEAKVLHNSREVGEITETPLLGLTRSGNR